MLPTLPNPAIPRIVTKPDVEKSRRTMTRKAFRHLLHEMGQARTHHGLLLRFVCAECQTPVALRRGEAAQFVKADRGALVDEVNEETDAFALVCACSIVTVDA